MSEQVMTRRALSAKTIALGLLERDGIAGIWQLHLDATAIYRDRHRGAAESLIEIADAAVESMMAASSGSGLVVAVTQPAEPAMIAARE